MDPDCIFCSIAAGDVPADLVHSDDTIVAFRDLNPAAPTHVLLIPRTHVANAAELAAAEPETLTHLVAAAAGIADTEGLDGYRLVFNTGAAAHQTVFHAHLHLLGGRSMTWPPG